MKRQSEVRISRGAKALSVFAALLFFTMAVQARPLDPILPLAKVKPGMAGYAKTVFSGLKVEKFPIVVRGILPGAGMSGEPMILVELTGPETEKYGGISMGMSGSPVYVNNKLIGALALTFENTDHKLGGVTPIESMLRIRDRETVKTGAVPLERPFEYRGKTYTKINYGRTPAGQDALEARFALAPIVIHGISARTFPLVRKFFEDSGIEVRPIEGLNTGGPAPATLSIRPASLEPGSSISVQLVRGDIDISAGGTLTAVDGSDVLMFGHPFFRKGAVKYLLADAYVHAIVNSSDMPYKLITTGSIRGEVIQDRGSALLGRLNVFPKLIPLKVTVTDRDAGRKRSFSFDIVKDDDILINLIVMAVLQSLDNTIDRIGSGSSVISYSIGCVGCTETIRRENMFYDRFDISARSLSELIAGLSIVHDNLFTDSPVSRIDINLQIDSTSSFASIEDAGLINKNDKTGGPGAGLSGGGEEGAPEVPESATESLDIPGIDSATDTVEPGGATDQEYFPDDGGSGVGDDDESPDVQFHFDNSGVGDPAPDSNSAGDQAAPDDNSPGDQAMPGGKSPRDKKTVPPEKAPVPDKQPENADAAAKKPKKPVPTVKPGEKLAISVQLRPYRQDLIKETIYLKVPGDIPPGNGVIDIYSGTKQREAFTLGDFLLKLDEGQQKAPRDQEEGEDGGEKEKEKSFAELIKNFNNRDHNNEIVATISSFGYSMNDDRESGNGEAGPDNGGKDDDRNKAKKRTGWVLQGSTSIKVKIAGDSQPLGGPSGAFKSRIIRKSKINTLQEKKEGGKKLK